MPIPTLSRASVEQALEVLTPELDQILAGRHKSRKYDLPWKGMRFPPKVVISKAVQLQYGDAFPESEFSGGEDEGHANDVLKKLGFTIVDKSAFTPSLPLEIHKRYGRKEIYALDGVEYDQKQRHLNTGLSPQCGDGGYFIFVTLNKEQLDPAHDYEDELYADYLIWISRRDVDEQDPDYANLRRPGTRVSLFVRNSPREDFVYAGELTCSNPLPIRDLKTGKPQLRFLWTLNHELPDRLLEELTFGIAHVRRGSGQTERRGSVHSRTPASFDEFRKAFSYAVGSVSDRLIVPEHYNYQVHLSRYLRKRGIPVEMERDFVDVGFTVGERKFIGEIKVTRNLTLPQAFRTALGQVIEYGHLLFPDLPHMVIFLDQVLDSKRVVIATKYGITVIALTAGKFRVLNPSICPPELLAVMSDGVR